jgi:putative oxidoreductase
MIINKINLLCRIFLKELGNFVCRNSLYKLKHVGDFLVRLWVANVFLKSGLSKIQDWNTTIVLFKYVYSTPLISPIVAAYIGTGAEFVLPILLVLGLGGRITIFALFVYNLMCAISFHFLWTPAGAAGLNEHIVWGLLLMMLMFHGAGNLSLDYLIHRKYGHLLQCKYEKFCKACHINPLSSSRP